ISVDDLRYCSGGMQPCALNAIYQHLRDLEARHNYIVDLLLMCGDFQAIRNHRDMQCMAVPQKYRQLGDFHKTAPVLTIVIGGNHEASNYMSELNDFSLGFYERLPYDHGTMRSIYHIREFNVRRLSLLSSLDIFLSHDWPQYIERHGDTQGLLCRKPFFRQDVQTGNLGSPPLMGLLRTLKPKWWFSAHLHVRFQATVQHEQTGTGSNSLPMTSPPQNPDEIAIADDDFDAVESQNPPIEYSRLQTTSHNPDQITLEEEVTQLPPIACRPQPSMTNFLALDKCLPNREFMEVCHRCAYTSDESTMPGQRCVPKLTFDPEWLAISRAFHPFFSTRRRQADYPNEATARAMSNVRNNEVDSSGVPLPGIRTILDCQTFVQSAPGPGSEGAQKNQQPPWYTNPQTTVFCDMLDIQNVMISLRTIGPKKLSR
ncbi:lariat debranching enzyme, C-terminal domain-containing protein, partial [Suillus plorans]